MTLPLLYKKSKTGAIVYCKIQSYGAEILVETGQVGTENPVFHETVCEPKNLGKVNESTAEEQAETEALAKHVKKIKSGYVLDESGETDVRLPMKVKVYQDQLKNVIFPCYESPKLNGVNFTVRLDGIHLTASSRGGEPYTVPAHQIDDIIEIMTTYALSELNGEQYIHGMHLQDIQAAVTKPNADTTNLVFSIFDIPSMGQKPYSDRVVILNDIADNFECTHVSVVPVISGVQNHETIRRLFLRDIDRGYEGSVIRNAKGLYVHNQRSSDVFKYKEAQDAEFKVISHKIDKLGHPVFMCESVGGNFNVKLKGTAEERLAMAAKAEEYYGQWLKVEFEVLSKAGKPTKPVGLHFRKCDDEGKPLE